MRFADDHESSFTAAYSDVLNDLYADSREAKRITEIDHEYGLEKGVTYADQEEARSNRMIEEFDEWLRS